MRGSAKLFSATSVYIKSIPFFGEIHKSTITVILTVLESKQRHRKLEYNKKHMLLETWRTVCTATDNTRSLSTQEAFVKAYYLPVANEVSIKSKE